MPDASTATRTRVTALVPCKNEEANMRDCLESVAWADEILMADSGSTDATMAIGREAGIRQARRRRTRVSKRSSQARHGGPG